MNALLGFGIVDDSGRSYGAASAFQSKGNLLFAFR